jgi:hypothetical protein
VSCFISATTPGTKSSTQITTTQKRHHSNERCFMLIFSIVLT